MHMIWLWLSGSAFLGWSLGANDAANSFGTAVSTGAIRFRTAAIILCVFIMIGAVAQGPACMHTLGGLSSQTVQTAFITTVAAAITVTVMTIFQIPVSVSQAVVGAIIGMGMVSGADVNYGGLKKVVACWVGTPVGAMIGSVIFYYLLSGPYNRISKDMFLTDTVIKIGLMICGAYGSYALGANNVANVTGVFLGTADWLTPRVAAAMGGAFICVGVITYGKKVMGTVGNKLVPLSPFTALVCVLSQAVVVHIYAMVGVPVSTSQAIVGAVLGIGIIKGVRSVNNKMLGGIVVGWLLTPVVGGGVAALGYMLFRSLSIL